MMERHHGERAADKSSVLHVWSAVRGVSVSGNNLHGRAGQRDEIKIKGKQKGSMSMCKCIEETSHSQIILFNLL